MKNFNPMDDMRRSNDLILSQGTFAFMQDSSSGLVEVAVGPFKSGIQDTDKMVVFNEVKGIYEETNRDNAIKPFIRADEGQYVVLTNPTETNDYPSPKSKNTVTDLEMGKRINIPGPCTFALYPGQSAKVVNGHQLKSNQYLLVRVYNADAAKENEAQSVVVAATEEKKNNVPSIFEKKNLIAGKLVVVKGTAVSFFIPPTGIEVLSTDKNYHSYVREAVTLERLEYCILLDENGEKDYTKGPSVVFPSPTQSFVEKEGVKKFRAIELNDNMGLYVKVIADYEEDSKKYKSGDEIFITGKTTKIYYPRPEHQLITYEGQSPIHYATTVPTGEGRYLLNKDTGAIDLKMGPKMLLPNPIKEVLVRRILSPKLVGLLFPGNHEALRVNEELTTINESYSNAGQNFVTDDALGDIQSRGLTGNTGSSGSADSMSYSASTKSRGFKMERQYLKADEIPGNLKRKSKHTKPRELVLDTKYSGAVMINIWPGFAVQVIGKTGDRKVEVGPKIILLKYDETLEVLSLSTGKPKHDHNLLDTTYLQINHNIVSDIITAITSDFIEVKIRLSYRVNFEEEHSKKWFNVSDYVKLMTQHLRSIVRNAVKKVSIETFNEQSADIIRDTILGKVIENKPRIGRAFDENGMVVYDVEVLDVTIEDSQIDQMIKTTQRETISQNLSLLTAQKNFDKFKEEQKINTDKSDITQTAALKKLKQVEELNTKEVAAKKVLEQLAVLEQQIEDVEHDAQLARDKSQDEAEVSKKKQLSEIETTAVETRMKALDPKLIAALDSFATISHSEILTKNLKEYQAAGLLDGESGGFQNLLKTVEGTPLASKLQQLVDKLSERK